VSGIEPEESVRQPALLQAWRDVSFLHWPCDPDTVAKLFPPGLEPDVHDGLAWLSLTPFSVRDQRLAFSPAVPKLSNYPETNVRTYAKDRRGVDGLWFLTVEADNLPTVVAARKGLGLPYRWAAMEVSAGPGPTSVYKHRRRNADHICHHIEVARGNRLDGQDELTTVLTGRWRGFTQLGGKLVVLPVQHQPWTLHAATVQRLDETLLQACGLPAPSDYPLVHWSPGVDVRFGAPRPVRKV
jgi:uncharacterized protein YqjF (DUF2071 family)